MGDRLVLRRPVALPRPVAVPVTEAVHLRDSVDDVVEAAADDRPHVAVNQLGATRLADLATHLHAEVTLRKALGDNDAAADDGNFDGPHQPMRTGQDMAGQHGRLLVNLGVWNVHDVSSFPKQPTTFAGCKRETSRS